MEISDRKRTILTALITLHADSGDPVGSGILAGFLESLSVSSATLRNEMAELTTLGLLEQPHTSAGRIPTQLGIRYYIDNLMNPWSMESKEREQINRIVRGMDNDPEKATEKAAGILAELFGLSSVAMTPRGNNPHLVHFRVLKIGRYNYALIGVTDAGSIQSRVCRIEKDLSESRLHHVEQLLNKYLVFISPEDVNNDLMLRIGSQLAEESLAYTPLIQSALSLVENLSSYRVYTDGEQNLFSYRDVYSQILPYLEYINDSKKLAELLLRAQTSFSIYIGEEIDPSLTNLGMITGHFRAGRLNGHLGVIGPARMNYAYILPRLRYFCEALSEAFSE
ncbi:MAG: heat-inducible transcriptional repressor HrcA [Oscillospiraceae bacterium]|nr:heat-inducible transcriptional repressor HrcA [Oscillospiraceae bacterium]